MPMSDRRLIFVLATTFYCAAPILAHAEPLAPRPDIAAYNEPQMPAPPKAGDMVAVAPQANNQASNLGGGLFEFLVTGRAQPQATPSYVPQQARYAPEAEPRRTVDPAYLRHDVAFDGHEKPGTIIVDTEHKFLYFVEPGNHALRYGIGVGRPGFLWSGVKSVTRKAEWPDWTPPAEMLLRRPDLPTHMVGGPANPLGARALYLGSSLYRIHGTNEPTTIGTNVSSGCIRMMNEDVIDLYERVKVGTKVIVI
jgi:lipoprotein-anchoring transpeptidase ErfK/SrfK